MRTSSAGKEIAPTTASECNGHVNETVDTKHDLVLTVYMINKKEGSLGINKILQTDSVVIKKNIIRILHRS